MFERLNDLLFLALRPARRAYVWWQHLSGHGLFVASFVVLISVGTAGLLWLPGLYTGAPLSFVDALFTITSAVCVTGLTVVDTATYFTFWGQLWVLAFIQLGGLGLFTLTTLIIGGLGRRLSLRTEMITGTVVELTRRRTVVALTMAMARFTFAIELVGALALFVLWLPEFGVADSAWHAVFHSVSAFCNAGFSTFSTNLVGYADHPLVLCTVSALIILGGLGYLSIEEFLRWRREGGWRGSARLSTHTFAVLTVTAFLLVMGAVAFAFFEWSGTLRALSPMDRLANAWFMSVTSRTAGFNSVSYAQVGNATAFLTILLMIVGGSPGSTAGGIKTTSLAVLAALAYARLRGRQHVLLHGRTLPDATVQRTVSLSLVAFGLMTAALFALGFTESHGLAVGVARQSFLPQLFEVTSALATVGLSMDVTPTLSVPGKLIGALLMFAGRVGPLALFAAISLRTERHLQTVRPAREDLIIG